MKKLFLFLTAMALLSGAFAHAKVEYLDNREAKIGIDMNGGGAVVWFSAGKGSNVINHFDLGRCVQQSYYGDADGSNWNGTPWIWNPIQGGDWKGKKSKILDFKKEKNSLYVKTVPTHWATGKPVDTCVMESWITLEGDVAKIRYKFEYTGKVGFKARHQELPALFTDAVLDSICFRDKEGALQRVKNIPEGNQYVKTPRHWAALVGGKDGRGVGMYFPGTEEITYYRRAQAAWKTGDEGPACSYFAPIRTFAVKPGLVFEYEIFLKIGSVEELEKTFDALRKESPSLSTK